MLNFVDYLLIAILFLSAVMGLFRGFVKEALSLIGWIVAIWAAWRFGGQVSTWVPDLVGSRTARVWVARVIILIGVLIGSGVVSGVIAFVMGRTGLDGTDRLIGMIFGLGRGVILAGVAVSVLEFAGFREDSWWQESKLIPYAAPIAENLREIADEGMEFLQENPRELETSPFSSER